MPVDIWISLYVDALRTLPSVPVVAAVFTVDSEASFVTVTAGVGVAEGAEQSGFESLRTSRPNPMGKAEMPVARMNASKDIEGFILDIVMA